MNYIIDEKVAQSLDPVLTMMDDCCYDGKNVFAGEGDKQHLNMFDLRFVDGFIMDPETRRWFENEIGRKFVAPAAQIPDILPGDILLIVLRADRGIVYKACMIDCGTRSLRFLQSF